MKKIFIHIFASVLVLTYIFSNVGYAVHKCEESGSVDVVSLLRDVSCEDIHEQPHDIVDVEHSCGSESCGTHGEKCCDTEIFNLSAEQDVRASLGYKKSQFPEAVFLFLKSEIKPLNEAFYSIINFHSAREIYSSLSGREKLTMISTWIL